MFESVDTLGLLKVNIYIQPVYRRERMASSGASDAVVRYEMMICTSAMTCKCGRPKLAANVRRDGYPHTSLRPNAIRDLTLLLIHQSMYSTQCHVQPQD
jgi:hypothetical protein